MPPDDRPFILQWRSAVLNSALAAPTKLALLALAEYADTNGGRCCPSMASVARLTSLSEKTVRRALDRSDWLQRTEGAGAGQGWRTYSYQLQLPEGADTRTARTSKGAAPQSPAYAEGADSQGVKVGTLTPKGAVRESDELGFKQGKNQQADARMGKTAQGIERLERMKPPPSLSERRARIEQDHHYGLIDAPERDRRLQELQQ